VSSPGVPPVTDSAPRWRSVAVRTTRVSVVLSVVDDDTGERVPAARVALADGTPPTTVSGGYHVFTDLGPGPVAVRATATGYDAATPTVTPVDPTETDAAAFVTDVRLTSD
jgi:hypothetical protein